MPVTVKFFVLQGPRLFSLCSPRSNTPELNLQGRFLSERGKAKHRLGGNLSAASPAWQASVWPWDLPCSAVLQRAAAWTSSAGREWGSLDFQDDAMSNRFIDPTILGRDNNPAITHDDHSCAV